MTKIFCDIVIRKSVFHGVSTARAIHLFYDVVFVFNPFAAGATVVFNIGFDMEEEKRNVSNQWINLKIIGLQFQLIRMDILYICNEYGEVRVSITQGINRHNPLMI